MESDPHQAAEKLQALITLLEPVVGGDPLTPSSTNSNQNPIQRNSDAEFRMCLRAARRELLEARKAAKVESLPHLAWIHQQLRLAEESPKGQARAIWRSIIELYGDNGWARDEVETARARLNATPPGNE